MKSPAVYNLTNQSHLTLYVGLASDLIKRVYQHNHHALEGFTKKYNVDKLVCFELHEDTVLTIQREKTLKKWLREWKILWLIKLTLNGVIYGPRLLGK